MIKRTAYFMDGDTFEHAGNTFRVTLEHDQHSGPPWEQSDGHGVVTDWERREAGRGEWELNNERGYRRFYNWCDTLNLAKRERWGLGADDIAKLAKRLGREPSKRDIRKESVRRDFEYLHGWCNDEWTYLGVIVELLDSDGEGTGKSESLWGVESLGDYSSQVARKLADNVLHEALAGLDEAIAERD